MSDEIRKEAEKEAKYEDIYKVNREKIFELSVALEAERKKVAELEGRLKPVVAKTPEYIDLSRVDPVLKESFNCPYCKHTLYKAVFVSSYDDFKLGWKSAESAIIAERAHSDRAVKLLKEAFPAISSYLLNANISEFIEAHEKRERKKRKRMKP